MILLLYTTINQMRPIVVIETIHDHVLAARICQRDLLNRTRRSAQQDAAVVTPVRAAAHGYVVRLELDLLAGVIERMAVTDEVVLQVSIGQYVAYQDLLATVRVGSPKDAASLAEAIQRAVILEQQRDLDRDPAYGIEQLAIIGWTSISTAKSNPSPGAMVLHSLRDLLARWSVEPADRPPDTSGQRLTPAVRLPVVYVDNVFAKLLDAFETLAVVASESMQPQTISEFFRTFALMFERLLVDQRSRVEDLIRRSLSALGEHVLTAELDAVLSELTCVLEAAGRSDTAAEVRAAQAVLGASVGKLRSRATRAAAAD